MNIPLHLDIKNKTKEAFFNDIEKLFGFPSWWGHNGNAMIDCLRYMRDPYDDMVSVKLKDDDIIVLEVDNVDEALFDTNLYLYEIVAYINKFYLDKYCIPVTILLAPRLGLYVGPTP